MKIDNEKFIDIRQIVAYYGKDVILKLPHTHPVTVAILRLIYIAWEKLKYSKNV